MKLYRKLFLIVFIIILISFSIFSVIKIKIQSGDLHQYFDKRIDFISDIFINTTRIHVWNLDYTELERNIRTSLKMEENLKAIFIKLGSTDSSFIAGEKEDKENIKIFQGNSHKKKYLQKFERASIKKLEQDIYYYNENIGAVHFFFDKKYIEREIKKEISSLVIQFISLAVVLFIGVYFAIQRIIIKPLYIFKEISDLITKKVTGIQKDISKDKDSIYSEKLMVPESIYYNEKLSEEKDEFGQLYNSFVTLIETINIQLNIIIDYSKGLESKVRQRTEELKKALEMIYSDNYKIEKRMMLKVSLYRDDKEVASSYALNDFVINRDPDSQMLKIELYINNELVNNFRGDGLILATPTGSTAYSLSAGGPIINPRQIKAILITPICPHNLHLRPMVISDQENIRIRVDSDGRSVKGCADGRQRNEIIPGDDIYISGADQELSIIKLPDRTFYTTVKEKMHLA